MVWWTHSKKSIRDVKACFSFKNIPDIIYQSVNIMFDCNDPSIDGNTYHFLANNGVNIFNVDLTKHDQEFFNKVKDALKMSEEITKAYAPGYYRPVGLSIMMSVKQSLEVDDRVDIIILKDITKTEELYEFRQRNKKFSSVPILSWPQSLRIQDLDEIIKMSAGLVLDRSFTDSLCEIIAALKTAREAYKPVFHLEPNIMHDFHEDASPVQARRILIYGRDILSYKFDGVIVVDCVGKPPTALIQSLVKAIELAEYDIQPDKEYFKRSLQTKRPVLAPVSLAFGACIAALKCNAAAIIVITTSGASARLVAHMSSPSKILAVTVHKTTARRMHLHKNVTPVYYADQREGSWYQKRWARVAFATRFGLKAGLLHFEDMIVILAAFDDNVGYSNSFQIVKVSDVIKMYGFPLPLDLSKSAM